MLQLIGTGGMRRCLLRLRLRVRQAATKATVWYSNSPDRVKNSIMAYVLWMIFTALPVSVNYGILMQYNISGNSNNDLMMYLSKVALGQSNDVRGQYEK